MKKFFAWIANLFSKKPPVKALPLIEETIVEKGPIPGLSEKHGQYVFDFNRAGVRSEWESVSYKHANRIIANLPIYEKIADAVKPDWRAKKEFLFPYAIGCIHMMESSFDLKACLHNGEKIIGTNRKTTLVPKGRGPFATFEEAAIDALKTDRVHNVKVWDIPHTLEFLEGFNGWGYRNKGVKSPYLWSGTTMYTRGKYVSDGKYDPQYVSKQCGCVAVLKQLGVK